MSQHTFSPTHGAHHSPQSWYEEALTRQGFQRDAAQATAIERLETLHQQLLLFKQKRHRTFARFLPDPDIPRGVYLWGGVGRGKSFLMDAFYACLPYRRKHRVHFHHFMFDVHKELRQLQGEADPLQKVADGIARKYRVICFDEFHVSDIADAMILARLMRALFERGVVFVMTSNYPPDGLYPNGLKRENFLPAIALLNESLDAMNVDGGQDYRLRTLTRIPVYLDPHGPDTNGRLNELFNEIATGRDEKHDITIEARTFRARRRAPGVAWFDFATLCGGLRNQVDYLELARTYPTLILSELPKMGPAMASEARRFTWLVDVCYDQRVKLILSAAVPAEQLYTEGSFAHEFVRTVSRLQEMQSKEYLALPHIG